MLWAPQAAGSPGNCLPRACVVHSLGVDSGLFSAFLLLPSMRALSPETVPRLAEATIDPAVLFFSLLLCILTGVIFGIGPRCSLRVR